MVNEKAIAEKIAGKEVPFTIIEYMTRDLFKGKSPQSAARAFLKKHNGTKNLFIDEGKSEIEFTEDELVEALIEDKAKTAIGNARRFREGKGSIALAGTAWQFNIPVDDLAKAVAKLTGGENVNGILDGYVRTAGNPGEEPQKVEKSVIRGTLPTEDLESICFILRDKSLSDDEMAKKISEATNYVSFEAGSILVRAWRDAGRSEKEWQNPELIDFIKKQLITKMGKTMNKEAIADKIAFSFAASEILKVAKELVSAQEPKPKFDVGDKVKTWNPDLTEIWSVGDYDSYAGDRRYVVMNPASHRKLNIFEKDIRKA